MSVLIFTFLVFFADGWSAPFGQRETHERYSNEWSVDEFQANLTKLAQAKRAAEGEA